MRKIVNRDLKRFSDRATLNMMNQRVSQRQQYDMAVPGPFPTLLNKNASAKETWPERSVTAIDSIILLKRVAICNSIVIK